MIDPRELHDVICVFYHHRKGGWDARDRLLTIRRRFSLFLCARAGSRAMSDLSSPGCFITERRTPKKAEVIDLCDSPLEQGRTSIEQTPTVDLSPYLERNNNSRGKSMIKTNLYSSFKLRDSLLDSPDTADSSVGSSPSTGREYSEQIDERMSSLRSHSPSYESEEAEFDESDTKRYASAVEGEDEDSGLSFIVKGQSLKITV